MFRVQHWACDSTAFQYCPDTRRMMSGGSVNISCCKSSAVEVSVHNLTLFCLLTMAVFCCLHLCWEMTGRVVEVWKSLSVSPWSWEARQSASGSHMPFALMELATGAQRCLSQGQEPIKNSNNHDCSNKATWHPAANKEERNQVLIK